MSFISTIIVALLAFAGTYLSNHKSNAIWQYRVKQLEEKQDKHNSVIERTYALERKVFAQEKDMNNAFGQIEEIKESVVKVDENVQKLNEEIQQVRETEVKIETKLSTHDKSDRG